MITLVCLFVCWFVRSFVTLVVTCDFSKTPKFDFHNVWHQVQHLRHISLITYERSLSKFEVKSLFEKRFPQRSVLVPTSFMGRSRSLDLH